HASGVVRHRRQAPTGPDRGACRALRRIASLLLLADVRYGLGTVGLVLTVAVALRYINDISLIVVWQGPAYLYPCGLTGRSPMNWSRRRGRPHQCPRPG